MTSSQNRTTSQGQAADANSRQCKDVFLTAEWRDLVLLNYKIDPALLKRYVPSGTALDFFEGSTYVSLVGFRFCRTRLFGRFPVPLHTDFEEVNLRFYVRRQADGEVRRGVVFIAEIVPRVAISSIARIAYGENYKSTRMTSRMEDIGSRRMSEFRWRISGKWCRLSAEVDGLPRTPNEGGLEQFITEHYWGYSRRRSDKTIEYRVSHEPWRVWIADTASFEGDAAAIYGDELASALLRRPDSAFVAEGSPVTVFRGKAVR